MASGYYVAYRRQPALALREPVEPARRDSLCKHYRPMSEPAQQLPEALAHQRDPRHPPVGYGYGTGFRIPGGLLSQTRWTPPGRGATSRVPDLDAYARSPVN